MYNVGVAFDRSYLDRVFWRISSNIFLIPLILGSILGESSFSRTILQKRYNITKTLLKNTLKDTFKNTLITRQDISKGLVKMRL